MTVQHYSLKRQEQIHLQKGAITHDLHLLLCYTPDGDIRAQLKPSPPLKPDNRPPSKMQHSFCMQVPFTKEHAISDPYSRSAISDPYSMSTISDPCSMSATG